MKICTLLYPVIILQIINSSQAETVVKTEAPAKNAGKATIQSVSNDTEDKVHQKIDPVASNSVTVESIPPDKFKDTSADISANVGQASQIQSSFDDVPKPKVTTDKVVINSNLPGVLNQGTLSYEPSDVGTLEVASVADSASADLHKLASSASTDVVNNAKNDNSPTPNATAGAPPPIVILPSDEKVQGQNQGQSNPQVQEVKTESTTAVPVSQSSEPTQPPVVRAEPKKLEQSSAKPEEKPSQEGPSSEKSEQLVNQPSSVSSEKPNEQATLPPSQSGNPLDLVSVPASEIPQEEIPSFSEWTQKQLEEAEKKKGQNKTAKPTTSRGPAPSKVRSKNYASPDCGAKIVANNPEAENPSGVLANSKDEYLINKCSTQRMWLIIELCEAVQAKKIELANFELFSSSPKDFSVYLSHNFPSRDWASVGQFTAKDERTVQSFNLQPHLFGKFLKVEFNSHYGKEHFCCTSLIRVYGTSEFEVLETENEGHGATHDLDEDDEDEQPIGADSGKPAKNLFGHATDAVYTIVRKAAEVLVKSGDSQNKSQTMEQENNNALIQVFPTRPQHCSTLRHLVVCNNCSEEFFDRVYNLLSCHSSDMQSLIESPFVFDGINNSQLCSLYGLDYISKRYLASPLRLQHEDQLDQAGYLEAMLPAEYISALCNILAVREGKVVLNTSQAAQGYNGLSTSVTQPQDKREVEIKNLLIEHKKHQTCSVDASFTLSPCEEPLSEMSSSPSPDKSTSFPGNQPGPSTPSLASEIRPTRTLTKEEAKDISAQEGSIPQVPVQKSGVPLDVTPTASTSSNVNVEPSLTVGSSNTPAESSVDKAKLSTPAPEIVQEPVIPDQPVLEAPPLEKEKDLADPAFGLDSGVSEDQEQTKDLDALFLEMKALDNNEETSTESSSSSTTPSSVVTQTRTPSQQAQKESVFLRLSNKIKALERNMSLSGQYLEELSRRYKKQEELSRALNKTLVLLREEIRKSKDREQQRDSDLHFLRTQLIQITATVDSYQSERDSWQHKAVVLSQHFVLIVIEVVMFGVVVSMCRRLPSEPGTASGGPQRKWSTGWRKFNKPHPKHFRRRSSLYGLSHIREVKIRRPSEEALQITGSYKDLLLQEENVIVVEGQDITPHSNDSDSWLAVSSSREQRRKRKRRKEGLVKSSSSSNLAHLQVNDNQSAIRKISAPLQSFPGGSPGGFGNDQNIVQTKFPGVCNQSGVALYDNSGAFISENALVPDPTFGSVENGSTGCSSGQIPSSFVETATSLRNRRSFNLAEAQLPFHDVHSQDWRNHLEGDSGSSASGQSSRSKGLDSLEPVSNCSQSDSQSGFGSDKKKKLNRKGGIKSMVKKFF